MVLSIGCHQLLFTELIAFLWFLIGAKSVEQRIGIGEIGADRTLAKVANGSACHESKIMTEAPLRTIQELQEFCVVPAVQNSGADHDADDCRMATANEVRSFQEKARRTATAARRQ